MEHNLINLTQEAATDYSFIEHLYSTIRSLDFGIQALPTEIRSSLLAGQCKIQHNQYISKTPAPELKIIQNSNQKIGRFYTQKTECEWRIIDISILPEWQNKGIGSYLLKNFISEAKTANASVSLFVFEDNPALGLYQSLGFTITEKANGYFKLHCQYSQNT